ncbi:hypothetical protein [Pseudomonas aeruginosa]|uniref:hypothetical protein n=1 Tax=Pseudomonas aeruginosa TaxID=287 RepID=UPI00292BC6C7|nr:hypothetical protein [Pseudomonas aeruginosa]HEC0592406.1 hypothetical protein [Pseudomonas aeruginosa]HEC1330086.1 hypothetical protein [Pseudomonas aeruginosa]HEC1338957.1 hypothetical protein [Pseudomonas aeruginosa]HEC1371018.1 hypothetical protein [Pseudomonas aeruginosa]
MNHRTDTVGRARPQTCTRSLDELIARRTKIDMYAFALAATAIALGFIGYQAPSAVARHLGLVGVIVSVFSTTYLIDMADGMTNTIRALTPKKGQSLKTVPTPPKHQPTQAA